MAHYFVGTRGSDADNGSFADYAGKVAISGFDSNAESLEFYWHQTYFFGEARAIAYADYGSTGSNAFVGGASDHCHVSASNDPKCWALAIIRI